METQKLTFEQYDDLKARDSFGKLRKKIEVVKPILVRFRGKVYQVIELKGDNLMLVKSLQRSQKHLVHEIELDVQ